MFNYRLYRLQQFLVVFGLDLKTFQCGQNGQSISIIFLRYCLTDEVVQMNDDVSIGLQRIFVVLLSDVTVGLFKKKDFLVRKRKGN